MSLILRSSAIHSVGCYTTAPLAKGAQVVEYTGPRLTVYEANELYEGRELTYLFGLEDGKNVIDGNGMAAFINHSCDPNCFVDEVDGRVWIFALRNIAEGEELAYDYNLYDGEDAEDSPCTCGAANCRGTMYAPEEYERLKRAARKSA